MRYKIRNKIGKSYTLILVIIFFITSIAWADSIHVPGDFATIQEAINAASAGDTIIVGPGIYMESVIMKSDVSLLGSGPHRTSIISPDPDKFTLITSSKVFVEGFTIAQEGPGQAIPLYVVGVSPTIRNNIITRIGNLQPGDAGIIVKSSTAIIEKNFIYNHDLGIWAIMSSSVIRNNIIKCQRGIVGEGDNLIVVNNTIITIREFGMSSGAGGGTFQTNVERSNV